MEPNALEVPEMVVKLSELLAGNRTLGLRASTQAFDYTPAARCVTKLGPLMPAFAVLDANECEAMCALTPNCNAAQLSYPWKTTGVPCNDWNMWTPEERKKRKLQPPGPLPCIERLQCELHSHCLERVRAPPAARADVMHRIGPVWPPGATPERVRWRTNATVVLVSYHASLSWLRTLPGGIADLVVYHKADLGRPNISFAPMTASYIIGHLREQELCSEHAFPSALRRMHHPTRIGLCPLGCRCGRRPKAERPWLQYFTVLPNYGMQRKEPYGGSREPYGYLQFILDFWNNMPPVVIFSQDDCLARGCAWGQNLPVLSVRLQRWEREWGEGSAPTAHNCLCKYIREDKYRNRGYFWYRWMSFAQERLFAVNLTKRSNVVDWPQDATFAAGRSWVRHGTPRWMYEVWLRLTTVELACMGAGTIMWAHSLERLWFEVFDVQVTKAFRPLVDKDGRGACFLGARR